MSFFLSVIGMVMIIEGIPYFGFPGSVKLLARRLIEVNDGTLRAMGLLLTATGLIVVYIGRRVLL